ncbi:MAG TPA: winged helix DNA-binding domain-containing protein [Solirubrobacteraceae bacterium]|nr:winged helix DNA-binding domain-containing protein [Solirubrobacteraceae bacterium]
MIRIDPAERRARLARRHRLAPAHRAADAVEAADSMLCLHATDPATVFLSARSRVDGLAVAALERELYDDRSLVKHLAMRRTLFVFPRETLGLAQAGASDRVADFERRRLIRDVEKHGLYPDGERWLSEASALVLEALADGREATSAELRAEIPLLEGSFAYGEGKSWGGQVPIGPRVLTTLSAAGRIVRASNDGGWAVSRPRWTSTAAWLGEEIARPSEAEGVTGLVERWLRTFGPGTAADIKWWLGSTVAAVRRALAVLEAIEVDLDGRTGHLLPDDLEPTEPVGPWGALLPSLDPTTMGWFEREWYLGDYKAELFDTSGNAGPTVWWEGRIVGGWRQGDVGEVILQLLEDVGADALQILEREAARLTDWLGGARVMPRFPSPLSKALAQASRRR